MTSSFTKYRCFTHWWAALPAVPADRRSLDWWAAPDGRCTPYERLKRVWFDSTRLLRPQADPLRPHEFANPNHGTHLTCKTWENFVLFSPKEWVPRLLSCAGLACPIQPVDCAWSYEFEAMVGETRRFKLADVVLHARDAAGGELLVVVEVKRPGDKLKEDSDLPDTEPASYLDREGFGSIPNRLLLYLVDAKYAPTVREKVHKADSRWGVVTWAQLAELQMALASELHPSPLAVFLACVLRFLYSNANISNLPMVREACGWNGVVAPSLQQLEDMRRLVEGSQGIPQHLAGYAAGALQHLRCATGTMPESPAFDYLREEPTFEQIHNLPKEQRQTTPERRRPLWRLPPRGTKVL